MPTLFFLPILFIRTSLCQRADIVFVRRQLSKRVARYALISGHRVSRLPTHRNNVHTRGYVAHRSRTFAHTESEERRGEVQTYRVTMEQRPSVSDSIERTKSPSRREASKYAKRFARADTRGFPGF